jgi:hypothetical protein
LTGMNGLKVDKKWGSFQQNFWDILKASSEVESKFQLKEIFPMIAKVCWEIRERFDAVVSIVIQLI